MERNSFGSLLRSERPVGGLRIVSGEIEEPVAEPETRQPESRPWRKPRQPLTWWMQQVYGWHYLRQHPSAREINRKRKELVKRLGIEQQLKDLDRIQAEVKRLDAEKSKITRQLAPKFRKLLPKHERDDATRPDVALDRIARKEITEPLDRERERLLHALTHAVTATERRAAIAVVEKVLMKEEGNVQ